VVDINNDGLADIYVCNSLAGDPSKRQNILYVNKGLDKAGIPIFKDEAKAYGLDVQYHSTMASFFDYDNDGDLDMYLTVNRPEPSEYPNSFRPVSRDGRAGAWAAYTGTIGIRNLGMPCTQMFRWPQA
jgi:hypothetical protein